LKQPLDDETGCGGALFDPALAAVRCPIERGPVKEGSDADRYRVSTTITATSVAYLVSRPKPSNYPNNNRLVPYERMTWQLTATLLQYKQESDGDVHLIVQDIGPEALPGVWDAVGGHPVHAVHSRAAGARGRRPWHRCCTWLRRRLAQAQRASAPAAALVRRLWTHRLSGQPAER